MSNLTAVVLATFLPLSQFPPLPPTHRSPVPVRQLTHANGVVTTAAYDAASQLTDLTHALGATTLATAAYTYSPVGNRLSLTDGTGTHGFTHDLLNRLTAATHPLDPLEAFAYDAVGNRDPATSATDPANRLLDDGTCTYTYDANGNRTSQTNTATLETTTYTYNAENQLTRITFPDATVATYAYDGLGRRIQKDVNGTVTRYVYDQEDILLEYDGSNQLLTRFTHGPGIDEPWSLTRDTDGDGSLETTAFYHADGLGSIVALTDAAGNVSRTYRYNAFGALTGETGTLAQPYTYTGRELDQESGLYYYRARYYDPRVGRFLQEDPIAGAKLGPQTLHKYSYVRNNPATLTDPSGEVSLSALVSIVTTVAILLLVAALTRFGCEVARTPQRLEEAALQGIQADPEEAEEIALVLFGRPLTELTREELVEVGKHTPEFKVGVAQQGARLVERAVDVETSAIPSPSR